MTIKINEEELNNIKNLLWGIYGLLFVVLALGGSVFGILLAFIL